MLLVDVTHTSHTRARTGVQQVTRSVCAALREEGFPVCHDPYRAAWRPLRASERENLVAPAAAIQRRSARWPWSMRLRGRFERWAGAAPPKLPHEAGLLVPEVFSATVGAALPALLRHVGGPRVAVFHDALPLQFPELTPSRTVARFPHYLRELLAFDGIAAVSATSRDALAGYWQWLGVTATPPILVLPHGLAAVAARAAAPAPAAEPEVLCVGSLEPRKNHLALLAACDELWAEGRRFRLRLIGLANAQAAPVLQRLAELQADGRPVRYDGPVGEAELHAAYDRCTFTVYPSLGEGFGLPVAESLAHGRPCICLGQGATAEVARGGGCVELPAVEAAALAAGLRQLLDHPADIERLAAAARQRRFRTWSDYVHELRAWMQTLPRR
jgi:glycosyltransferase involved in cell wall biosynthesis